MPGTVSAFFDESGQEKEYQPDTKYYLLTMVLHDQSRPIAEHISRYESCLAAASLPDIPFHAYDLFHRQKGYEGLDFEVRKKLFFRFAGFVRRLPVNYVTFAYRRSELKDSAALSERLCKDLVAFVESNLAEFQSYDTVAVYYDGGQDAPRAAIRRAFDETLSVNTAEYKKLHYRSADLPRSPIFSVASSLPHFSTGITGRRRPTSSYLEAPAHLRLTSSSRCAESYTNSAHAVMGTFGL